MRRHLPILALYCALAVLATWPLAAHLTTHYPSAIPWYGGDPNIFTWWIDWIAKAMLGQLPVAPGKMVFWPVGIDPLGGWDGIIMLAIGLPVRLLTGNPILAYNCIVLAALVATAFSAYLFMYHLTRSRYAATFGGLLFGFSTYMIVRMSQHANLILLFAVPLMALATIRFCEKPERRTALWLGPVVFIAAISSWYYLLTGVFFMAIAFIAFSKELWKARKVFLIACVAMAIGVLLPAIPLLLSESRGGKTESIEFIRGGGAAPANFILPHPFTNFFGPMTRATYEAFPKAYWGSPGGFEATSYFGIVVLAAVIAFALLRKKLGVRYGGIWTATLAFFTVLALGVDVPVGGLRIPLPFTLLVHMFPFSQLRVPNRFFVWALLAGAVIASFAIERLRIALKTPFLQTALAIVIAIVITADQLIFPYPLVALSVPDFYKQIAKDGQTYALAELPVIYPGFSEYDYFQTIHGKPVTEAEFFYTAYSDRTFSYIKSNPLLAGSICRLDAPVSPLPDKEAVFESLRKNNVRFVVIHNLLLHNTPGCAEPMRFIRAFFDDDAQYFTDGEITVYQVSSPL